MFTIDAKQLANLLRVVVDAHPNRKIEQIKELRSITGFGLKESKDLIEAEHDRREPPADLVERAINQVMWTRRSLAERNDCADEIERARHEAWGRHQ